MKTAEVKGKINPYHTRDKLRSDIGWLVALHVPNAVTCALFRAVPAVCLAGGKPVAIPLRFSLPSQLAGCEDGEVSYQSQGVRLK